MATTPEKPLYKYLEPRWARAMLDHGEVLIGSLSNFREKEKHNAARGDTDENRNPGHIGVPFLAIGEGGKIPRHLNRFFPEGCEWFVINGIDFDLTHGPEYGPDHYTYCCSTKFDRDCMAEFGGSCVRINRREEFFDRLKEAIGDRGWKMRKGPVIYGHRDGDYDAKLHRPWPAFVKDPSYEYQSEYRATWLPTPPDSPPTEETVKPFPIRVCAIRSLISLHYMPRQLSLPARRPPSHRR